RLRLRGRELLRRGAEIQNADALEALGVDRLGGGLNLQAKFLSDGVYRDRRRLFAMGLIKKQKGGVRPLSPQETNPIRFYRNTGQTIDARHHAPAVEIIGDADQQFVVARAERQIEGGVFYRTSAVRLFANRVQIPVFVYVQQFSVDQHPYVIDEAKRQFARLGGGGFDRCLQPHDAARFGFAEFAGEIDEAM